MYMNDWWLWEANWVDNGPRWFAGVFSTRPKLFALFPTDRDSSPEFNRSFGAGGVSPCEGGGPKLWEKEHVCSIGSKSHENVCTYSKLLIFKRMEIHHFAERDMHRSCISDASVMQQVANSIAQIGWLTEIELFGCHCMYWNDGIMLCVIQGPARVGLPTGSTI